MGIFPTNGRFLTLIAHFTPDNLADELGFSKSALARYRSTRNGPECVKFARNVMYSVEAVDVWLSKNTYTSTSRYRPCHEIPRSPRTPLVSGAIEGWARQGNGVEVGRIQVYRSVLLPSFQYQAVINEHEEREKI